MKSPIAPGAAASPEAGGSRGVRPSAQALQSSPETVLSESMGMGFPDNRRLARLMTPGIVLMNETPLRANPARSAGVLALDFKTYLCVAVGGALGTLARFWVGLAALPISQDFPWGTLLINILGSFVIGFFGTLTLSAGRFPVSDPLRLFVMIGVCGGFTTFSSFSLQTLDLIRGGFLLRAIVNVTASVALCLCAVAVGHAIASSLNGGAKEIAQIKLEEDA